MFMAVPRTLGSVVLLVGVAAVATSLAAGSPMASKQRIAIEVKSSVLTGDGTFTLIPLSAGPVRSDSGRVVGEGDIKPSVIRRTGQRVTIVLGADELRGKHGTLRLTQRIESADAGSSFSADTGSWVVIGGSGSYAALSGGGRLAGIAAPDGRVVYRQEGYVTKG
jgi:hypothetical protein